MRTFIYNQPRTKERLMAPRNFVKNFPPLAKQTEDRGAPITRKLVSDYPNKLDSVYYQLELTN